MTPEERKIVWAEYEAGLKQMSVEDFNQEYMCTPTPPKKILVIGASSGNRDSIRKLLAEHATKYEVVFDEGPVPEPHMTMIFDEFSSIDLKAADRQKPRNIENYLRDCKSWKGRHNGY